MKSGSYASYRAAGALGPQEPDDEPDDDEIGGDGFPFPVMAETPDPESAWARRVAGLEAELAQSRADHAETLEKWRVVVAENGDLREGAALVLAGFEAGVFIRDTTGDRSPGWTLKLVEPLRGIALLSQRLAGRL